jgi:hypothetical protein
MRENITMKRGRVVLLALLVILAAAPAAQAKYPASITQYMSCAVDANGWRPHGSADEIAEPRAVLVSKVQDRKVVKVALANHCDDWVSASWGTTMLIVRPGESTDLWKDEFDPMPRATDDDWLSLDVANPPWSDQACNYSGMVFMAAEPDTHVPICGAADTLVRKTKPATPLPAGKPDKLLPCGDSKSAAVWFKSIGDEDYSEHVAVGGINRCKRWLLIAWSNRSETNRHESYLWLAPGQQFNWDRMHLYAWSAATSSYGGWYATLVDARTVCVNASGDPGAADPDDPEYGFAAYAFTARVYGWKDVRSVKNCPDAL